MYDFPSSLVDFRRFLRSRNAIVARWGGEGGGREARGTGVLVLSQHLAAPVSGVARKRPA